MSVTYLSMSSNRLYLTPRLCITVYKALFSTHLLMHIYSCLNLYINMHTCTLQSHMRDIATSLLCVCVYCFPFHLWCGTKCQSCSLFLRTVRMCRTEWISLCCDRANRLLSRLFCFREAAQEDGSWVTRTSFFVSPVPWSLCLQTWPVHVRPYISHKNFTWTLPQQKTQPDSQSSLTRYIFLVQMHSRVSMSFLTDTVSVWL